MRAIRFTMVSLLLTVSLAGMAQAVPMIQYAWNGCVGTAVVPAPTKDLTYPSSNGLYNQYVSVEQIATSVGAGESVFSHTVQIVIGPNVPDAWRFDPGGCEDANFSTITYNSAGVANCVGVRNGAEAAVTDYSYDPVSGNATLTAGTGYPAGRSSFPNPRYLLWELKFSLGAAGAPCGGEHQPLGFQLTKVSFAVGLTPADSRNVDGVLADQGCLEINDPSRNTACAAVPTQTSTWGRVKGMYR